MAPFSGVIVSFTLFLISTRVTACPNHCHCTGISFTCQDLHLNNTEFKTAMQEVTPEMKRAVITGNNVGDIIGIPFWNDMRGLNSLEWKNNNITAITSFAFTEMENLQDLWLDNNSLTETGINVFFNTPKLRYVSMRHAFAHSLPNGSDFSPVVSKMFGGTVLHNLLSLDLSDNNIKEAFQPGNRNFLCDLPNIEELNMSNNNIHELNFETNCGSNIHMLDLSSNHIHTLSDVDMRVLSKMDIYLDISNNPFTCNCITKNFIQWLRNGTFSAKLVNFEPMICATAIPHSLEGSNLFEIDLNLLECPSKKMMFGMGLVAQSGTNWAAVMLCVVIICIVGGVTYKYRWRITRTTYKILSPMRKKNYQTLDLVDDEPGGDFVEFEV